MLNKRSLLKKITPKPTAKPTNNIVFILIDFIDYNIKYNICMVFRCLYTLVCY